MDDPSLRRIRIAIADDHALFRQGLKSLLALREGLEVVAECARADEIRSMLDHTPCDVLLLDLQMDRNLLVDVQALAERVPVVLVTASEVPDEAVAAIRAGARGVVFKRFAVETLVDAVGAVMDGHVWMPPSLQAHVATSLRTPAEAGLTAREREIARWVALGLRNAEVARKLFIGEQTVKTHLNNIFLKVGVRDRVELTLYAVRTGLIGVHEYPS
ncbi:MAG TPA: response regulator transcription factor [Candidatus Binatia bacterium]|nr:response regulator transcription factor [Candidatus Binatia bacterium]